MDACPCGSGRSYDDCCGALHRGAREATTAEEVMRARYSAFVVGDAAYLLRTWDPSTRPESVRFAAGQRWTGLEVLATAKGNMLDREGEVEFVARYQRDGTPGELHELSRFVRHEGRWVYLGAVDAEIG